MKLSRLWSVLVATSHLLHKDKRTPLEVFYFVCFQFLLHLKPLTSSAWVLSEILLCLGSKATFALGQARPVRWGHCLWYRCS